MDEINVKDEIITAVKEAISANTTLAAVDWEPAQLYSDDVDHIAEMVAENLYAAGYRKQSDTAREILDEVSRHFGGAWLVELYKKYGAEVKE